MISTVREIWFNEINNENPTFVSLTSNDKLKYIMKYEQKSTGVFVTNAFDIRKNTLYK